MGKFTVTGTKNELLDFVSIAMDKGFDCDTKITTSVLLVDPIGKTVKNYLGMSNNINLDAPDAIMNVIALLGKQNQGITLTINEAFHGFVVANLRQPNNLIMHPDDHFELFGVQIGAGFYNDLKMIRSKDIKKGTVLVF